MCLYRFCSFIKLLASLKYLSGGMTSKEVKVVTFLPEILSSEIDRVLADPELKFGWMVRRHDEVTESVLGTF